ncbi:hypothetical protein [Roseobacter cerasinus]|nr:hypothetical protein [Roseobacter cerasinus]
MTALITAKSSATAVTKMKDFLRPKDAILDTPHNFVTSVLLMRANPVQ